MSESDDETFDVDGVTYSLVMPFVVCDDHGGPYPSEAFAAGIQYAQIEQALTTLDALRVRAYEAYVRDALVPQIDLLTMHLGWRIDADPSSDAPLGWVLLEFSKLDA